MRYVILRDDDTNALTPPEYLERLYRPFLQRSLPVNLAVIPNVRTDITYGRNILEGFLLTRNGSTRQMLPIASNPDLVQYLQANPGFHIAQHGYNHEFVRGDCEFEQHHREDLTRRLDQGHALLQEAGFKSVNAFVAPYDRFTRTSLSEISKRFRVISTAWLELRRLPYPWWPCYLLNKVRRKSHWQIGSTILLTHPRCYLSFRRPYATMLDEIKQSILSRRLTVLVAHWWEFFRDRQPDNAFIEILHKLAEHLAAPDQFQVITFREVATGQIPLN